MPGFDGGAFDVAGSIPRQALSVTATSNGTWVTLELDCESPFTVAIGYRDRIVSADQLVGSARGLALYAPGWTDHSERQAAVSWVKQLRGHVLQGLGLESEERVVIAKNKVLAGLRPSSLESFTERLDALIDLAGALPATTVAAGGPGGGGRGMPPQLAVLDDLAAIWSVADDDRRSALIDAAPDGTLEDLYARVRPYFGVINGLLGESHEPIPPERVIAGRLAEAATEANIELTRRRRDSLVHD